LYDFYYTVYGFPQKKNGEWRLLAQH
jgi:hypothetical protein